jgi:hypothetical protein
MISPGAALQPWLSGYIQSVQSEPAIHAGLGEVGMPSLSAKLVTPCLELSLDSYQVAYLHKIASFPTHAICVSLNSKAIHAVEATQGVFFCGSYQLS